MATHEQPSKKERTPTQRMLAIGAGVLGLVLGAEFLKSIFHHN